MNRYNVYIPIHSDDSLHRCNCTKSEAILIAKELTEAYDTEGGVFVLWERSFSLLSFTIKIEKLVFQTKIVRKE